MTPNMLSDRRCIPRSDSPYRTCLAMVVMSLVLLTGCAGSPTPSERYTLPGPAPEHTAGADAEHVLLVESLDLAEYLDNEGIVLQLDELRLNEASQHLWAERLDHQLERGLRHRLAERLDTTYVASDARDMNLATGEDDERHVEVAKLRIDVDRFQGDQHGYAIAGGRWQLRNTHDRLIAARPFNVRTELEHDGYPALVRALGASWDGLADEIATVVRERYRPSE
ncbi:PqiC family protein [Aidingimonas lacisalsi]|uniref:PqiC family protein n=1 Tax=Aidingimonas lacisalsi TaxID=2604086 RepID=UPI001F3FB9BA|nr:ABC-type transport auxiliary lipoprotein family protein [Aidingimonas lacisalsi]